jgi:serine O-acetyltransferase
MVNNVTQMLFSTVKQDLCRNFPKGYRSILNILNSPGVIYVLIYRFGWFASKSHALIKWPLLVLYFLMQKTYGDFYGIHISRHAHFDGGLKISHSGGIFVNPGVKGGQNITLSQGVTIGASGKGEKFGTPCLGDNIYLAPNAILHGKIIIGSNVKVGPNAVVYCDLPDNVVVLSPKPIIKEKK